MTIQIEQRAGTTNDNGACFGRKTQRYSPSELASISTKCYLNVREASLYIGISERKLRDMLSRGVLRQVRLGSRIIIRREDIDKYLDALAR